jgi:hypothetical protein
MSSNEDQKKVIELLTAIAKWSRFSGIQTARQVITSTLQNDAEKLAYHYSDGRASRDVAKMSGLSDFTIRNYWKKWNIAGLVFPSNKFKGRYERAFSLEDFGIELPATRQVAESSTETGETTQSGTEQQVGV